MNKPWALSLLLITLLLTACGTQAAPAASATEELPLVSEAVSPATVVSSLPTASSAQTYLDGLLYVREEEKLAWDVYLFLYDRWGVQVFQNIASSEQAHTDAVKTLLDAYGLTDPAASTQSGEFVNPDLQALYNQLTAQGSLSLAEALKVGAAIEEIDIHDLNQQMADGLPDDIRCIYENLLFGSYNHLSTFTSTLERQTGEIYAPQYMSLEAYQSALDQAARGGYGGGNGSGNGQGGRP